MKIKLNLSIFLVIILFIITNQIKIYLLIMIFALIHEVSHLICGVSLGFKSKALTIMPFGFSIEFEMLVQDYNKKVLKSNNMAVKNIFIALAGPVINLIIVILGIKLKWDSNIIYSNFLICIFNLIPIYPLDGGRMLLNILKILYGNKKAHKYINCIANVLFVLFTMFGSILILIYKNISILLIIVVLLTLIIKENIRYNSYNKINKIIDKK